MTDVYLEHMVKRVMTPALRVRQLLLCLGGAGALLLASLLAPHVGLPGFLLPPAGLAAAFLACRLARAQEVEFEYTLTNGEFDLDKIMARSTRKRLLSFHCRDVERLVPFSPGKAPPSGTLMACSFPGDQDLWRCTVKHPKRGSVSFVFNGNEPLLAAMSRFLPGAVRREALESRS